MLWAAWVLPSPSYHSEQSAKNRPYFLFSLSETLDSVFRAGVWKEIHTVTMLAFGFSHAGGSPADMDTKVGQSQSISFPSSYTGMSYQE
jgi:hypothetical protein